MASDSELGSHIPNKHLARADPQDQGLIDWQPQPKAYCGQCKRKFKDTIVLLQHISTSNK